MVQGGHESLMTEGSCSEKKKRIVIIFLFMLSLLIIIFLIILQVISNHKTKRNPDISFVEGIGAGINIGNSLDSTGKLKWNADVDDLEYETFWGNELLTPELFEFIRDSGFGNVRIPVSWDEHIENGIISKKWMKRVHEVVDMAYDCGLYVILNLHHETWLSLELDKEIEITDKFCKIWEQIAEEFRDYDSKLIFEAMNEPRLQDSDIEWTKGETEYRQMINRLNRVFYDTVRRAEGYNTSRYLMIGSYCNSVEKEAIEELEIPGDKIIVSVHGYKPYNFCFKDYDALKWNDKKYGTDNSDKKITEFMKNLNEVFIKKGIPVVITEFAAFKERRLSQQREWLAYYISEADKYGISYIWWDDGRNYKFIDRKKLELRDTELADILLKK